MNILRFVRPSEEDSSDHKPYGRAVDMNTGDEGSQVLAGTANVHDEVLMNARPVEADGFIDFGDLGEEDEVVLTTSKRVSDNVYPIHGPTPARKGNFPPDEVRHRTAEYPVGYFDGLTATGDMRTTTAIPNVGDNYPAELIISGRATENRENQGITANIMSRAHEATSYEETVTLLSSAIQTRIEFLKQNRPVGARIFLAYLRNLSDGTASITAIFERDPANQYGFDSNLIFATGKCLAEKLEGYPPKQNPTVEEKKQYMRDFWAICLQD